jgi:hypothetical protein
MYRFLTWIYSSLQECKKYCEKIEEMENWLLMCIEISYFNDIIIKNRHLTPLIRYFWGVCTHRTEEDFDVEDAEEDEFNNPRPQLLSGKSQSTMLSVLERAQVARLQQELSISRERESSEVRGDIKIKYCIDKIQITTINNVDLHALCYTGRRWNGRERDSS